MGTLVDDILNPTIDLREVHTRCVTCSEQDRAAVANAVERLLASKEDSLWQRGVHLSRAITVSEVHVPVLVAALEINDWQLRYSAVRVLERLGPKAIGAIDSLMRCLDEPEQPYGDRASWAIMNIGVSAVPTLLVGTTSPSVVTRARSFACLSSIILIPADQAHALDDERARELAVVFLRAVNDPEPWVRLNAINCLTSLHERFVQPSLIRTLGAREEWAREQATLLLSWTSPQLSEAARAALDRCRSDHNHSVRTFAEIGMNRMGYYDGKFRISEA